jgi:hypothetical protein
VITGHLGVAAALRSRWRGVPLLWLLAASVAPDVLDVGMAIAGICNPYGLYSHTVPAVVLLAATLGGAAFLVTDSRETALVTAAVILLHLPPDLVTGHKIFWPGGDFHGLALHWHPRLDFLVEVPVALGGWWLLRRTPGAPRWATSWLAAAALVIVQGAFDFATDNEVKPTACASARSAPYRS